MSDLLWSDVEEFFDPESWGTLPGVTVADASVEDWQTVLDLVQSSDWGFEYSVNDVPGPLPSAASMLTLGEVAHPMLRVWPVPGILVNFFPHDESAVDFDVDLLELQGQERLDVLLGFMRAIGRALGKPVLFTPEGYSHPPVLRFDVEADRVVLLSNLAGTSGTSGTSGTDDQQAAV